ncbi:MAG: hypothetical protein J6W82_12635, partial [Bacteroidales bacterium]|nr:hypothetical protein [Bacteroidales bacterium]
MKYYDKLIFELSKPGRCGYSLPASAVRENDFAGRPLWRTGNSSELSASVWRESPLDLPEVSEPDVVRHYT